MSLSGFPTAPLSKDPRRFCEGDPYRARGEAVTSSEGGFVRRPGADRRFQNMPPLLVYRDSRDWTGQPNHSDIHTPPYSSPGHHINNSFPPPFPPHSRPDAPTGPLNHDAINHSLYLSVSQQQHPELGYQTSGRPYSRLPPPTSSTLVPNMGQPSSAPCENGFRDEIPSATQMGHTLQSSHHPPSSNAPNPGRYQEHWWSGKPRPLLQDHTHRAPPHHHHIHGGDELNYRHTLHADTNTYREKTPLFRDPPVTFQPDFPSPVGEGYWRGAVGPVRGHPLVPRPGWKSGEARHHSQRKPFNPTLHKNFHNTTEDSRRNNHMSIERCGVSYPPPVASQPSWSPDDPNHAPDLHGNHHHHGNHAPFGGCERVNGAGGRDIPKGHQESGRYFRGAGERRRNPAYHERKGPVPLMTNGLGSGNPTRDPRQASLTRAQRSVLVVLQEHSYSRKHQEGCEEHPRFHRVPPCSQLNPQMLTELLKSSCSARGKGHRKEPNSTGPAAMPTSSLPGKERVFKPTPSQSADETSFSEKKVHSQLSSISSVRSGEELKSSPASSVRDNGEANISTSRVQSNAHSQKPVSESDRSHQLNQPPKHSGTSRAPGSSDITLSCHANTADSKASGEDKNAATSLAQNSICSLDGFHLDLDLEPTSGSNSGSTCCSENEDQTGSRTGDSDMEIDESDSVTEDNERTIVGEASDEEVTPVSSLPGSPRRSEVAKRSPEKWSVTSPEPGKMLFSRVDSGEGSPEGERLALKQMTSNRIQLRNGRVLPASSLAYLTKVTSPTLGSSSASLTPSSPSSTSSSPQTSRLRRSRRLAGSWDPVIMLNLSPWKETSATTDSDSMGDQSFEAHLSDASSGESDFEMPDFGSKSSVCEPPQLKSEIRGGRGKRGRGRGRWSRRGMRRGGGGGHGSIKNEAVVEGEQIETPSGVQFYDHKPRTREEGSVLQRRLALEMEVKRNEKIQSSFAQSFDSANTKVPEDDRGSVESGSLPPFTVDPHPSHPHPSHPHTLSSTSSKASSVSTEFSAELIARVKKIATARSSGDTPLHKCCRTGKYDMVRYLLQVENAGVNVQDNAGWTPLHEAASNGHRDVAELLLSHGADSNISARDGTRPIHDAIEIGSLELVKLLVDHKADLMVEFGERTAIEFARDHHQVEIASYIKDVIQTRQEERKANLEAARNNTHQKATPPRSSKKDKVMKQMEEQTPRIPVNGYGPGSVSFGEELDFPLFFVSPIIELSSRPHLPVYNFQISPPGTVNPRRHNFYLMDDLLETLCVTEDEFISKCCNVNILELNIAEFLHRMKVSPYNLQVPVPERLRGLPKKKAIKFVPLCQMLCNLLDIVTENIDN